MLSLIELTTLSAQVGEILKQRKLQLVTAESCTGGLLGAVITQVSGASKYFDRGFITYGNLAKEDLLHVNVATLDLNGAVSEEVAREMAQGALESSEATVAMAITGIAGPTGGTPEKPIGTVCFAWAILTDDPDHSLLLKSECEHFDGDRDQVRMQSVQFVLQELIKLLL